MLVRVLFLAMVAVSANGFGSTDQQVQQRVSEDINQGRLVVVHVVVALCDNANQGIVPVPASLGNGQDPRSNLYWGAAYGVRTFLTRRSDYELIRSERPENDGILERIVLRKTLVRSGESVPVYAIADAWDGRRMAAAIDRFLESAAGRHAEAVTVTGSGGTQSLQAGGTASLVAFVGHNGLMDVPLGTTPKAAPGMLPRSSMVLACQSEAYFLKALRTGGSHPLLLTTGLMAPEAYTLDASIEAFVRGDDAQAVRRAAAAAYDRYQHCGLNGALRLFSTR